VCLLLSFIQGFLFGDYMARRKTRHTLDLIRDDLDRKDEFIQRELDKLDMESRRLVLPPKPDAIAERPVLFFITGTARQAEEAGRVMKDALIDAGMNDNGDKEWL
jgi:hypothetical protein